MPEVERLAYPFWKAFEVLSGKRIRNEVGPQAIQVTEIQAYLDLLGVVDYDDREDTLYYVTMLDSMFLKEVYEKQASKLSQMARRKTR